jgi:multicomponent Na+:H+ antiporter subunit G
MTDIATAIVWLAGSGFALLAAIGVLRMPDVFTRMQASTKASTLGLAFLLIGAAVQMGDLASLIRIASIGAFVLLTTPVSGHVIARAAYWAGVPLWEGTLLDERQRDWAKEAHADLPADDEDDEDDEPKRGGPEHRSQRRNE